MPVTAVTRETDRLRQRTNHGLGPVAFPTGEAGRGRSAYGTAGGAARRTRRPPYGARSLPGDGPDMTRRTSPAGGRGA